MKSFFTRQFKPHKFDSGMYDLLANMYRAGTLTVVEGMEHLDKKWANEGEP